MRSEVPRRVQEMDARGFANSGRVHTLTSRDGSPMAGERAASAAPAARRRRIGRGQQTSRRAAIERKPLSLGRSRTICFARALVNIECMRTSSEQLHSSHPYDERPRLRVRSRAEQAQLNPAIASDKSLGEFANHPRGLSDQPRGRSMFRSDWERRG
jgi:hypothetical protein